MRLAKFFLIILSLILLSAGSCFSLSAQSNDTTTFNIEDHSAKITNFTPNDYAKIVLPPLSLLLEAAVNSPRVATLIATKQEEEGNLKTVKRNWMNNIFVFGNYQYGAFGANVSNSTAQTGMVLQYTTQVQSVYNTGAGINLPIELLYNRNNRIKTQKNKLKQANYQILQAIDEQKMQIADVYSIAIQQLAVLKIKAEVITLSTTEMQMGEAQYLNGDITLGQLNSIKTTQATALINYESTRAELNKAILFLEILTRVDIIKK